MFSVLIEARPREEQWDSYLAKADRLRPDLEAAPGFVDAVRYRSLARDGWILSLSGWRDEASITGWHERGSDDGDRENGWRDSLAEHRLRIGEVTWDTRGPGSQEMPRPGAHGTEGDGTYVTLVDATQAPDWVRANNPQEIALYLGFDPYSYGDCISWDVFEAAAGPGDILLLVTWKDAQSAKDHASAQMVPDGARVRVVRIVRDDSMAHGREAGPVSAGSSGRETIRA